MVLTRRGAVIGAMNAAALAGAGAALRFLSARSVTPFGER